jgi:hypothetical protein
MYKAGYERLEHVGGMGKERLAKKDKVMAREEA